MKTKTLSRINDCIRLSDITLTKRIETAMKVEGVVPFSAYDAEPVENTIQKLRGDLKAAENTAKTLQEQLDEESKHSEQLAADFSTLRDEYVALEIQDKDLKDKIELLEEKAQWHFCVEEMPTEDEFVYCVGNGKYPDGEYLLHCGYWFSRADVIKRPYDYWNFETICDYCFYKWRHVNYDK